MQGHDMLNHGSKTVIINGSLRFFLPRAPGDTVILTAFIRDLKLARPDFKLCVHATGADQLLAYNPNLTPGNLDIQPIRAEYRDGIDACRLRGEHRHCINEFHRDFFRQTDIQVPLTEPRPDLHLSPKELAERPFSYPYWVVCAGYKSDMPAKGWSAARFQEVIERTSKRGYRWVQVGARPTGRVRHTHFPLKNVVDRVGQTNLRQLMQLVYHSAGVLSGASLCMLLAAAFWKPCVCIAGGRESWHWLSFSRDNPALADAAARVVVPHRVLTTIGQLDCCASRACYAKQVVPPHSATKFPDGYLCQRPAEDAGQVLPECMRLITTDQVIDALESYERNSNVIGATGKSPRVEDQQPARP